MAEGIRLSIRTTTTTDLLPGSPEQAAPPSAEDKGEVWPLPLTLIQPLWSRQLALRLTPRTLPRIARAWSSRLPDSKRKNYKGLLLEFALILALRRLGWTVHAASSPVAWFALRRGSADAVLGNGLALEAKNWGSYKVSSQTVKDEVLPRFKGVTVKLLVISSLTRWTHEARALLDEHGILPVQVGFQVTARSVGRAVEVLVMRLAEVLGLVRPQKGDFLRYLLVPVLLFYSSPGWEGGRLLSRLGGGARASPSPDLVGAGRSAPWSLLGG